jgi:hypothetical protein
MTRTGIFGATALSLSLAIAAPALAQHAPGGHAGARAAGAHIGGGAGMRPGGGPRMGGAPQANFRGAQAGPGRQANVGASNFAGRGNAQFAQQGAYRGQFRGDRGRNFGRGVGIAAGTAAGVAVGSALAYGAYGGYGYGYGYDPYYADTYAYDDGAYYDPGYTVAFDQPMIGVGQPVGVDASYCAQRFRSYDPASGTYLGYDGLRHPCP